MHMFLQVQFFYLVAALRLHDLSQGSQVASIETILGVSWVCRDIQKKFVGNRTGSQLQREKQRFLAATETFMRC